MFFHAKYYLSGSIIKSISGLKYEYLMPKFLDKINKSLSSGWYTRKNKKPVSTTQIREPKI